MASCRQFSQGIYLLVRTLVAGFVISLDLILILILTLLIVTHVPADMSEMS